MGAIAPTMEYDLHAGDGASLMTEDGLHIHGPAPAIDPAEQLGSPAQYLELRSGGTLVALEATIGARPVLLYCGPDIPGAMPEELALLATRQHVPGGSSVPLRGSLLNEVGTGISGPSGLTVHRAGQDWATDLRLEEVKTDGDHAVTLTCVDRNTKVAATHSLAIDPATGVLTCSTAIENKGQDSLEVQWCASLCLPLDPRTDRITNFTGRWAGEFQTENVEQFRGSFVRENKAGRTSHDAFPGVLIGGKATNEADGLAAAFHLAWSGNHRLRVDRQSDGRSILQMGELPFPGELHLAEGETYRAPDLLACWSSHGYSDVSRRLHRHVLDSVVDSRIAAKPRPVHYNTWEAVYFDHDMATLIDLAEKAASVGAERYVLDDGWFGGRRHENAGLGDWWVSKDVYPEGLHPLVNKVHELGMEFGLWFEPEMVNPDSDLFRAHPDWVLQAEGVETVPFRGQLTLDLTKPEVFDYLFGKITSIVSEYDIAYIKWDMNRDTNYPGSHGRGAMHRQTKAVYRLMEQLRKAHPKLEIESCSSGGGRADFGILRYTDRVWTSDNNDARQRQDIQRGASCFLPLKLLGSHVGPQRCHITGRRFSMEFRVATAIFGHMGMELDLREEDDTSLEVLKAGISLYKKHRELIHEGDFYRLESSASTNLVGCVSRDRAEALFSWAKLEVEPPTLPERVYFAGIDPNAKYRLRLVWPDRDPSLTNPSIVDAAELTGGGKIFSGSALMDYGIQAPLVFPDTCLIYHLKAEN